jgi:peroxiredoxin
MRTLVASLFLITSLVSSASAAETGAAAPDFTLKDLDGKAVHLADLKGKVVVLEWFNPLCPFVRRAHTKGSLTGLAARHPEVVWLGVNSAAPGKQGADPAVTRKSAAEYGMQHPVLLDPTGVTGKAYGATNTPHLFVIAKDGKLAYAGAIDNSPDAEGDAANGKLVNYVDQALEDLAKGRPLRTTSTKAYGCSVKY